MSRDTSPFYWTIYPIYSDYQKENKAFDKRRVNMKGYVIEAGYMGFVDGEYMLFANEDDYREYMND